MRTFTRSAEHKIQDSAVWVLLLFLPILLFLLFHNIIVCKWIHYKYDTTILLSFTYLYATFTCRDLQE